MRWTLNWFIQYWAAEIDHILKRLKENYLHGSPRVGNLFLYPMAWHQSHQKTCQIQSCIESWKTPPISLTPSVKQWMLFKTFYQFMCLKHLKPAPRLWITNKHKLKAKHKAKHKRRIQAWSTKRKRKHKHKKKKYLIVILLVSLCVVYIRETSAINSFVDSRPLYACIFYIFLCLSVQVCEHSFFMLVLVLVLKICSQFL